MTRRQIYFYSPQSGKYYVSEEINGDKTELERMGSSDYCENTWEEILDSLKNVAGMGDFLQALARLNGIYHSSPRIRPSAYQIADCSYPCGGRHERSDLWDYGGNAWDFSGRGTFYLEIG